MKKTAMQLLADRLLLQSKGKSFSQGYRTAMTEAYKLATELLETEREQIEEAYEAARQDQRCDMMPEYYNRSKQQYYEDTYK